MRGLIHNLPRCLVALTFIMAPFHAAVGAQTLTITATGQIPASCGLVATSGFSAANLDANGSSSATAAVNCNTKYVLKAVSANGGLKTTTPVSSASFSNKLDYQFTISVPLDNGAGTLSGSCGASNLTAGAGFCALSPAGAGLSSGGRTSTGKTATLGINWTLPVSTHLIAGSYTDIITISIAAQP